MKLIPARHDSLTPKTPHLGVRLTRPSEAVLDVLLNPDIGSFVKEDGEVVIDASGKRLRREIQNFQKFRNTVDSQSGRAY